MKKILFLLLSTIAMYGQIPADATPLENIQITNNVQDNAATKVTVQDDDGVQNWLPMANLPVSAATQIAIDGKVSDTIRNGINAIAPSENAVYDALQLKENISNKATDFTTVNNTLYPTVQAAKMYADGLVVGLLNDRGSYDASVNLYPSTGGSGTSGAIKKGNLWAISVAGTLGGVAVGVGDWVRALIDTPGQTSANWAVVEGNFGYVPENVANKSNSYTVSSTTTYPNTKALVDGLATKQNTLTNPVTGTGTPNTLIKWGSTSTGVNSTLFDNGGGNAGLSSSQSSPTMFRITNANAAIGGGTKLSFFYNTETGYFQNSFNGDSFETTLQGINGVRLVTGSLLGVYLHPSGNTIIGGGTSNTGEKLQVGGVVLASNFKKSGGLATQYLMADGSVSTGGGGTTNLSLGTATATTQPILNSNGTGITLPSATTTEAGLMSASDKVKVDGLTTTYAPLVSPTFTGTPTAPTATVGTNTTQIATMEALQTAITPNGVITTATNITNETLTDSGLPQNGKTILIENGANNINYTINGNVTASFVKGGTGSITFVQGSGRTMIAANGTLIFNGAQYSTASIVSFGTTDIVYINNF